MQGSKSFVQSSPEYPVVENSHSQSQQDLNSTRDLSLFRTTFIAEGREIEIDNCYIAKSPYISSIKEKIGDNEELRIILPKWVTLSSLTVMTFYLMYNKLDEDITYSDTLLQRLLWLSDFLQLDEFQSLILKEKVISSLNMENAILFLNEAFKKLKIEEESADCWYLLFNTSINIAAKNLSWILKNKGKELRECNPKIAEEVVDRSLRYSKEFFINDSSEQLELLRVIRNKQNFVELAIDQREALGKKKIDNSGHPSISWKLNNISRIDKKDTSVFKFGGFYWRLSSNVASDKQTLNFTLRLESSKNGQVVQDLSSPSFRQRNSDMFKRSISNELSPERTNGQNPTMREGILTVYYLIKANGHLLDNRLKATSINLEKSNELSLASFNFTQEKRIREEETEFVMYLNIEFIHSAVLTYVSRNIENYCEAKVLLQLNYDEIKAILESQKQISKNLEQAAEFTIFYCDNNYLLRANETQLIMDLINWKELTLKALDRLTEKRRFLKSSEVTKRISELKARISEPKSTTLLRDDLKLTQIHSEGTYYKPKTYTNVDTPTVPAPRNVTISIPERPRYESPGYISNTYTSPLKSAAASYKSVASSASASKLDSVGNLEEETRRMPSSNYRDILARTAGSPALKQKENTDPLSLKKDKSKEDSERTISLENIEDTDEICNAKVPLTNFNPSITQRSSSPFHHSNNFEASRIITSKPLKPNLHVQSEFSRRESREGPTISSAGLMSSISMSPVKSDRTPAQAVLNSPGSLNLGRLFRPISPAPSSVVAHLAFQSHFGASSYTQRQPETSSSLLQSFVDSEKNTVIAQRPPTKNKLSADFGPVRGEITPIIPSSQTKIPESLESKSPGLGTGYRTPNQPLYVSNPNERKQIANALDSALNLVRNVPSETRPSEKRPGTRSASEDRKPMKHLSALNSPDRTPQAYDLIKTQDSGSGAFKNAIENKETLLSLGIQHAETQPVNMPDAQRIESKMSPYKNLQPKAAVSSPLKVLEAPSNQSPHKTLPLQAPSSAMEDKSFMDFLEKLDIVLDKKVLVLQQKMRDELQARKSELRKNIHPEQFLRVGHEFHLK